MDLLLYSIYKDVIAHLMNYIVDDNDSNNDSNNNIIITGLKWLVSEGLVQGLI